MINIFGPDRQSIRLKEYDYASVGIYFVTICTQNRLMIFGEVKDERVQLSSVGDMVQKAWQNIALYDSRIVLDEFIVMPNHVHGIIVIEHPVLGGHGGQARDGGQARRPAPTNPVGAGFHPRPPSHASFHINQKIMSLSDLIQRFKSWTTYRYQAEIKREGKESPHRRLWQRNYYEHIVRGDPDLNRIREYTKANPANWPTDPENQPPS